MKIVEVLTEYPELYEEYTILWFEFDLCGLQHQQDRDKNLSEIILTFWVVDFGFLLVTVFAYDCSAR